MTENMKTAAIAINKWFYYSMNYKVVNVEVTTFEGSEKKLLPDCFNAFPKHLRAHLAKKWDAIYGLYGSRAVLMTFYGEISTEYRIMLIEWVMQNYNDEQKINFNTEED